VVAITSGASGAYVSDANSAAVVPGFRIAAVDTTGCGDAFTAGFLHAFLRGESLIDSAIWGNALGACCARAIGAMPSSFTYQEIRHMVQSFKLQQD
jgi:ribokinase